MIREYFARGERRTVDMVDDVVALKVAVDARGNTPDATRFGRVARMVSGEPARETYAAFRNAHWLFVFPSAATTRAVEREENPPEVEDIGAVVRRPDSTLAIVTKRLDVRLAGEFTEAEAEAILRESGLTVRHRLRFVSNLFEVVAGPGEDALAASVRLHDDARFAFAEPAFIEHIPPRFTPVDPRFGDQWQWANTGQGGGLAGADVSAEAAWDNTRGAGVRLAVIDNGFDADHQDLAAGVVAASGFYRQTGSNPAVFVQGITGMPDNSHGTFCAAMAGARQGNGVGGCGAAPECELLLIACLNDQVGTQTTLARAVSYAADPSAEVPGADPAGGAEIMVSSLGPNGAVWELTTTLELALDFAGGNGGAGRGMPIFWAASNGGNVDILLDEVVSHPNVMTVVRSTRNDLEDDAARGATVDLIAPGVDVFNAFSGNTYNFWTGNSFAAPATAGCAALALAMDPGLTGPELEQVMRDCADKIGGVVYDANGHHDDYGFGRVNANAAVHIAGTLTAVQHLAMS
ncbi:S8 family peptidase [Nocardia crassostreae]|uniref:S8 family peptidase n=1 Tax=Nocardia crassostreae TaxID=53428 RepID=UPI000835E263|nr:S8 family serine peptidase [Nocardia crassostreae]